MIKDILNASGLQYRRGRYPKPPAGTYVIYTDDVSTDAADPVPLLPGQWIPHTAAHEVTVELYEEGPDDQAEERLEAEILSRGLSFDKTDRQWLQDCQRYAVFYDLTYYTKTK